MQSEINDRISQSNLFCVHFWQRGTDVYGFTCVAFVMNIHKETAVDELFFTINHSGDWETFKRLIVSQLVASRLERLRMMQWRYIWQTDIKHQCVLHFYANIVI